MGLLIIYMLLAIGVSFLCSMMESVLLSLNFSYINVLKEHKPAIGEALEELKKNIDVSLSSILILNTVANTVGAAGVGAEAAKMFGMEYMFYFSALLTLLILFCSEIIPKTIGALYWKDIAPIAVYVIKFFIFITYPLIKIAIFVTKKISSNKKQTSITREELLASALMSEDAGIIDEKESDVIENVLKLKKSKVSDILTPRSVVFAVNKDMSLGELLKLEQIHQFSRIPVYDESIDHIIGVVMGKTIFREALKDMNKIVGDLIKPIFAVNENIPVSYVFDLFVKRKEHIFVVLDSYDQTEGIVTLEDCIETILGVEIVDEADITADMRAFAKSKKKKKKKRKNGTMTSERENSDSTSDNS